MARQIIRTTNGFENMPLLEFNDTIGTISEKMPGNPNFKSMDEQTGAFVTEKGKYVSLAAKAAKGGSEAIAARNAQRVILVDILHDMGNEVTNICKNNLEKMISSGFPYTKEPVPSPPLKKPVAPVLSTGPVTRQLRCRGQRQPGCSSLVEYYITTTPNVAGSWVRFTDTLITFTFENLESGAEYFIKYVLSGPRKQKVESDAVSMRPQ